MKLSDMKIGTRLYMGFGAIVALLVILVSLAYSSFSKLDQATEWDVHSYRVREEITGMLESLINIETGERGFALTGKEASLEPFTAGTDAFKQHVAKAMELTADSPSQQEKLQRLRMHQQQWVATAIDPVIAMRREVVAGKEHLDDVVAFEQAGKGKQAMDAMRALLAQLDETERGLLDLRAKDAAAMQSLTAQVLIGGGIVATILGALLAIWMTHNITRPLAMAIGLAKRVAGGDLTAKVEVRSKDETGELMAALSDMNESLVRIVAEVRTGSDTIAAASNQIAAGNLDLSSRAEQQASSLEETASAMEELTIAVKQNADSARRADSLAASASEVAMKGGTVVAEVVETMASINESSKKIVDIISVIDSIAFQTNILALNAAVEAARAGEQGRGFAVVATEVRNLAQRSAAAAKEIKTLINDSVEKVQSGTRRADHAGTTMEEIVANARRVTDIMTEITAASQNQTAGIEQINQAISQMDQVTQQNASLAEEAAAASAALQEQASNLAQAVGIFQLRPADAAAVLLPAMRTKATSAMIGAPAPCPRLEGAPPTHAVPRRESLGRALGTVLNSTQFDMPLS
jgi:methyl-accepting chemotaxis protein